jgi:hypothetical protein
MLFFLTFILYPIVCGGNMTNLACRTPVETQHFRVSGFPVIFIG